MVDDTSHESMGSVERRTVLKSVAGLGVASVIAPTVSARSDSVDRYEGLISSTEHTPRPSSGGKGDVRISLNGTWDFVLASAGSPPTDTKWESATVPGQWDYDGFETLEDPSEWYPPEGMDGWYRREFETPDEWSTQRTILRFGAVYSRATVWLNETKLGSHVGGYTPFEFDVTDELNADGDNVLTVAVSQRSSADDIGWQNVTGGITRDVTLFTVPETHLSTFDVTTHLRDDGIGTVRIETTVTNDGTDSIDTGTLRAELSGPEGEVADVVSRTFDGLEAGESTTVHLECTVPNPSTWNPERPRLYELECELATDHGSERVSETVGIRDIEVDGNELLLNGTSVTLRGVNWEEIHIPRYGQAVPADITRRDARRLREANINYVRTSHHPPSEAFVEACDELGIIVEVEAPHMFVGRGRPAPEKEVVLRQTLEMVHRDMNRPSVCLWSIANESEWYDAFETAGRLVSAVDPTRLTIFDHDVYDESDPWHDEFDIRSHHYPALRVGSSVGDFEDFEHPLAFDEYAHLYCYNDEEIVTDPGLRDEWCRQFDTIWEGCRSTEACIGAAVWAGGDHLERWGEYRWGLVDRYRRKRPEYWHVKKSYAPVRISSSEWIRGGTVLRATVENRSEFVDLSERNVVWESEQKSGTLEIDTSPGESETVLIPTNDDRIEIRIEHPEGFTIDLFSSEERTDRRRDGTKRHTAFESRELHGGMIEETDSAFRMKGRNRVVSVESDTGRVELKHRGRMSLPLDGPELVVTPTQQWTGRDYDSIIDHRLEGRTVSDVHPPENGFGIEIDVSYDIAEGKFDLRPSIFGVEITYEFTLRESRDAREVGIALPLSTNLTNLSWVREGYWSTYPEDHIGRSEGTATAFGEFDRPNDDVMRLDPDRNWAQDVTKRGSNDFRSTKRNIRTARLVDAHDRGIQVRSDGSQHVRCQVRDDAVDCLILDRSIAGTTPEWMSRYPVLNQHPTLDEGTTVQGSALVSFVDSSRWK